MIMTDPPTTAGMNYPDTLVMVARIITARLVVQRSVPRSGEWEDIDVLTDYIAPHYIYRAKPQRVLPKVGRAKFLGDTGPFAEVIELTDEVKTVLIAAGLMNG